MNKKSLNPKPSGYPESLNDCSISETSSCIELSNSHIVKISIPYSNTDSHTSFNSRLKNVSLIPAFF